MAQQKMFKLTELDLQKLQSNDEIAILLVLLNYVDTDANVEVDTDEFCRRSRVGVEQIKSTLASFKDKQYLKDITIGDDLIHCKMTISLKRYVNGLVPPPIKEIITSDPAEQAFTQRMYEVYPRVAAMQRPLTLGKFNYINITLRYTRQEIIDVLGDMENYAQIYRYIDTQRTLIKWLQKRYGKRT